MKTLLTVLMTATLISSVQTASACLPEIDGWMYRTHRAELSAQSGDAILVLRGHTSGHFNSEQLNDSVTVTVSREGVKIPGTLEMSVIHDTLIWRAEAPVDSDVEYAVTVTTNNGWWSDQQRQDQELKAVWPNEMEADELGELKSIDTGTYILKFVETACLRLDGLMVDVNVSITTETHGTSKSALSWTEPIISLLLEELLWGRPQRLLVKASMPPHLEGLASKTRRISKPVVVLGMTGMEKQPVRPSKSSSSMGLHFLRA